MVVEVARQRIFEDEAELNPLQLDSCHRFGPNRVVKGYFSLHFLTSW